MSVGQAWFWTPEWQQMMKEAQEDVDNGDVYRFDNVEDAIEALNEDEDEHETP